jgi:hypothetical protein
MLERIIQDRTVGPLGSRPHDTTRAIGVHDDLHCGVQSLVHERFIVAVTAHDDRGRRTKSSEPRGSPRGNGRLARSADGDIPDGQRRERRRYLVALLPPTDRSSTH